MTSTELVAQPYVIPDGIEPVEGWRAWNLTKEGLVSLSQGVLWPAGKRAEAVCMADRSNQWTEFRWAVVEGGLTVEQAAQERQEALERLRAVNTGYGGGSLYYVPVPFHYPAAPTAELPGRLGYRLEPVVHEQHDAPSESCACGLYALGDLTGVPGGVVFGKVKMWGKVIEGTSGFRAQYAYPEELWAPAKKLNDPALLAYGVPVHDLADPDAPQMAVNGGQMLATSYSTSFTFAPGLGGTVAVVRGVRNMNPYVYFGALGLNLAAAALNLLHVRLF